MDVLNLSLNKQNKFNNKKNNQKLHKKYVYLQF